MDLPAVRRQPPTVSCRWRRPLYLNHNAGREPSIPSNDTAPDGAPSVRLPMTHKRALKWALALVMLAGLVWWVQAEVGWVALLRPWKAFPPEELALLVLLTALSYLTRAIRLYELYRSRLRAPFAVFLRINVLHTTLLNLLPMRTGEVAFPVMMKRRFGEGYVSSVANLLWLRVADLWVLLWLGLVTFAWRGTPWLWLPVAMGAVLPLVLQPLRQTIVHGIEGEGRMVRSLRILVDGLPARYADYLRLLLWTLATWTLKLAAFVSVARFFIGGDPGPLVPGVIAAEISNALPVQGVAGFGSYELAMVLGGSMAAVPREALLAAAVNLHLFILACTLAFGALAWLIPDRIAVDER